MVSRINPSAQQMPLQQYHEPSDRDISPLRGRVKTSELNWTKVFAVSMLVMLAIAVPAAAAGVAAARSAQQDSSPTCSGKGCGTNGTCLTAPSEFYSLAIVERFTYVGAVEESDDKLTEEKAKGTFWSSELQERHFKETISKVDQYLDRASTFEAPADRAMTLHRAREIVKKAESQFFGSYRGELLYRSAAILAEEVEACQQAAERAPTPYKKLWWVRRAMEEMNLSTWDLDSSSSCSFREHENTCRVAAFLWSQAAEAFLQYPERAESHCYGLIHPFSEAFCDRLFAAARCFRNSAYCLRLERHSQAQEKRVNDLTRALQLQKNMNTTAWSLDNRAKLQEEIADTQGSLCAQFRNSSRAAEFSEKVYQESIEAHRLYGQLAQQHPDQVYYLIKSGEQLMLAGNYISSLKQKVELYKQARDLVKTAWNRDPDMCVNLRVFIYKRSFWQEPNQESDSLLKRLESYVELVERELQVESSFLQRWTQWFYR